MARALRKFTCPDCGAEVMRRRPAYKVVRCTSCAIEFQAEWNRQMAAKSGPLFEQWAALIAMRYLPDYVEQSRAKAGLSG